MHIPGQGQRIAVGRQRRPGPGQPESWHALPAAAHVPCLVCWDPHARLQEASETYLKGTLGYEVKPLVSTDYINERRPGVVDALSTQVIDGTMVKVYAW